MAEVKKKSWPEYFRLIQGGKKIEIRLADFDLKEGDTLVLEEYDPDTNTYTGKKLKKKAKTVIKFNPTKMHRPEEIKKFGFYIIEME